MSLPVSTRDLKRLLMETILGPLADLSPLGAAIAAGIGAFVTSGEVTWDDGLGAVSGSRTGEWINTCGASFASFTTKIAIGDRVGTIAIDTSDNPDPDAADSDYDTETLSGDYSVLASTAYNERLSVALGGALLVRQRFVRSSGSTGGPITSHYTLKR